MGDEGDAPNTLTLLSTAHVLVSRLVAEGVAAAGHPIRPSHSLVFGQLGPEGARLTAMARVANVTPQAMSELVDELESMGYVERTPDPTDRRAKLIVLTEQGRACSRDGAEVVHRIEAHLTELLGEDGHRTLRRLLSRMLDEPYEG
jgi:DNA-binding MarR family transcriptional regulator